MPTGVLMPVASISSLAFIGMVKEFETPGMVRASFISSFSFSTVMPGLHRDSGFKLTTVSNISRGAGSVAVSALPALPKTLSTSGMPLRILSCNRRSSVATDMDAAGAVTGM